MQKPPVKYGFVGAGFVARFHLSAIRQLRGIEVAGVTAISGAPELAELASASGLGETKVYGSVGEMATV
jgi:predicted dehydrogenase